MKRYIAIVIAAVMIVSLFACKPDGQLQDSPGDTPQTAESTPPAETGSPPAPGATDTPPDTADTAQPGTAGTAQPGSPGATPAPRPFAFTTENMPVIDGSTATIPLIEAVYSVLLGIPRSEAAQMVNTTGTDNAYDNLLWGDAEILLVYSPSPYTLERAKEDGIEMEMAPIGRDGLVFLINKINPVVSLTPEQLVSIYSGQTRNWKDVGGEDVEIKAFQRPYRSGSQTMMDALVMKGTPMAETEEEYVIGEMGGLIEAVALFDNARSAIGYNVYYFVSRMEMNENVRMLEIGGVEPSVASISDGSYPFVMDFYAVIRKDTPEDSPARVLFDWMQSPDGQNLVRHEGYATNGTGS